MASVFRERIHVAIDVGTTKICVVVAHQLDGEHVELLGIGKAPSHGLSKGVVVDVAKTVHSIRSAVQEAELMAGITIESASVGISGAHIRSVNSSGVVPIKRGEVTAHDIGNVLAAAKAIPIPDGQQILHTMAQYYVIDGNEKVLDPHGMHGIRLEVQAHIILGAVSSVQNLVKCCQAAGVKVEDVVLEQLASSAAVLSDDERELGTAVLDIGGGTSDLAIYQRGSIRHTMVLPVAGNHFTNDIALGLRTTLHDAERIKHEYALAQPDLLKKDELLEVECVQGTRKRVVRRAELVHIVHARAQEVLTLVHEEIITRDLQSFITAGLVLTGGGSLLKGLPELAHEIIGVPVRIGTPRVEYDLPESLKSPVYATGYGLIMYALKQKKNASLHRLDGSLAKRIALRMKEWVSDFF